MSPFPPGPAWVDLETREVLPFPEGRPPFSRRVLADTGDLLLLGNQSGEVDPFRQPPPLVLWTRIGTRSLYQGRVHYGDTISPTGRWVAMETVAESGSDAGRRELVALDTASGALTTVAAMPSRDARFYPTSFASPMWSNDAGRLVYLSYDDRARPVRVALWEQALGVRILAETEEGFKEAIISGDGDWVWALTLSNRLLKIDSASGATDEVLPALGQLQGYLDGANVPGSYYSFEGSGFAKGQQVLVDGRPAPVLAATLNRLDIQIPWEFAAELSAGQQKTVSVRLVAKDHPLESRMFLLLNNGVVPVVARVGNQGGASPVKAAHQDFRGLVSEDDPGLSGETLHVWLSGLGPLDRPVATGEPSPSDPPARPLTPFACYLIQPASRFAVGLRVPSLTYAPALIGVYQADVTLPDPLPRGIVYLVCEAGGQVSVASPVPVRSAE